MASVKFLVTAALLTASSSVAFAPTVLAQDATTGIVEAGASTAPAYNQAQVASVVARLKATTTNAGMNDVITPVLTESPASAPAILTAFKAVDKARAATLFRTMIAILSTNEANEAIVQALMEQNEDLVAMNAGEIEPAGGDDTAGQDFAPEAGNPSENPGQLNSPSEEEPGLSPVAPLPAAL